MPEPVAIASSLKYTFLGGLAALTSADKEQGVKELARQRELSRTTRPQP
jgi:hypothetical protein